MPLAVEEILGVAEYSVNIWGKMRKEMLRLRDSMKRTNKSLTFTDRLLVIAIIKENAIYFIVILCTLSSLRTLIA